jgi:hypothetical protein
MPDTQQKFDAIMKTIVAETNNRSKGSWNRALWYGGQSKAAKVLGAMTGRAYGDVRDAPLGAGMGVAAVRTAGMATGPFAPVVQLTVVPLCTWALTWVAEKAVDAAVKAAATAATTGTVDFWDGAQKNAMKDLGDKQSGWMTKIKRNIEKLQDAQRSATQAIIKFNEAKPTPQVQGGFDYSAVHQRAHDALRVWAEVRYYRRKVDILAMQMEWSMKELRKQLEGCDKDLDVVYDKLKMRTKEVLAAAD